MDVLYTGMSMKRISLEKPDDIKDVIRREIISYLRHNNLSQYGVAKEMGLPASYINQVLSSQPKAVSFSKLCEIAHRIGMKLTLVIEKK